MVQTDRGIGGRPPAGGGPLRGEGAPLADKGQQSVLVRLENGEFLAYSAVCTRQEACAVAHKGGKFACPCYGSAFDPASSGGAVLNGPANRPLPELAFRQGTAGR